MAKENHGAQRQRDIVEEYCEQM